MLETADFGAGTLTMFLPEGVSPGAVVDFWRGGKMGEDTVATVRDGQTNRFGRVHNTRSVWLSLIDDHLGSSESAFCLFEDQLARVGDQKLSAIPAPVLTDGRDVYYFLNSARTDRTAIETTFNRALSIRPLVVAFLARQTHEAMVPLTRSTLDVSELRAIVAATEQILIGAYDGESFLRWRGSPRKSVEAR